MNWWNMMTKRLFRRPFLPFRTVNAKIMAKPSPSNFPFLGDGLAKDSASLSISQYSAIIGQSLYLIETGLYEALGLAEVAAEVGLSTQHYYWVFQLHCRA